MNKGRKKNMRRASVLVTAQTLFHLKEMAAEWGCSIGAVIDRLTRERMLDNRNLRSAVPKEGKGYGI